MTDNTQRYLLQSFGFIVGLFYGYLRPIQMMPMFLILGFLTGFAYFLIWIQLDGSNKKVKDFYLFVPTQMTFYFILGSSLSLAYQLSSAEYF
ncbi:hypothetical protein [Alkalibacterium sp. MB6]|uniref:hypothetical protein n=1 Tax=Alkalibacterium sp. MB6 TaxID=2081965 RepID=UPI00137AE395|nr:hypothetical protein [Alkalibacterium sp. MB6]